MAGKPVKLYEFRNNLGQYLGVWAGRTAEEAIAKAMSESSWKAAQGFRKHGLVLTEKGRA